MPKKAFWNMTKDELAAATSTFNEEFVAERSRALSPAEQRRWRRLKAKRGRPKKGAGYQRVSISLEKGLLSRTTAQAKKQRIARSQLIAQALQSLLASQPT